MNDQISPVGEVIEKASLDWKIQDFTKIFEKSKTSENIESTKFKIVVHNQVTEWQLKLYPKGREERCSKLVSLVLECLSDVESYVKVSFAIVNHKNTEMNKHGPSGDYLFKKGYTFGYYQFIKHDYLFDNKKSLLPGDELTLRCEIILDRIEEYYEKVEKGKIEDFNDFGMLFNNPKLSDVQILIKKGPNKFYAHKYVLVKKSKVFEAMFRHDMLENKNNSVNIEDFSREAIYEMLRYIYIGRIFDVANATYLDVLKAADKYQIHDLKKICENKILSQLKIENSVDLLTAADQSNALTLKTKIIDFIVENAQSLIESPEFKSLTQLHPELFCELFRKMHQKLLDCKTKV